MQSRVASVFSYAFSTLWRDLALWYFTGLLIGGVVLALLPQEFFSYYLGGGVASMVIVLLLSLPVYICATGSTPIAAAMIMKGTSPGVALVFLLAGPATNVTSIPVLTRILGVKGMLVYLSSLAGASIFIGLVTDALYHYMNFSPTTVIGAVKRSFPEWMMTGAAAFLLILFLYQQVHDRWRKSQEKRQVSL